MADDWSNDPVSLIFAGFIAVFGLVLLVGTLRELRRGSVGVSIGIRYDAVSSFRIERWEMPVIYWIFVVLKLLLALALFVGGSVGLYFLLSSS